MPIALLALAMAWGVMLLFGGMELDRALALLFHVGSSPQLTRIARLVTEIGGYRVLIPATLIGAILLLGRKEWRSAVALVAITLSGRLFIEWQKIVTERVRPEEQVHLVQVDSLSFPSGHAGNATIVWLCLAFLLPGSASSRTLAVWAAVWIALAVGLSRVMLGVHWFSDVIGGWAFGLFWTMLLLRLSGHGIGDGTGRLVAHSSNEQSRRRKMADKTRPDDSELIDEMEDAPSQSGASGGNLQRDVGARAEEENELGEPDGVTRVRGSDRPEGADLPRFNQK